MSKRIPTCIECGGTLGAHFQFCPETPEPVDQQEPSTCGMCDGAGVIDAHEDDPNWYHPGDTKPCPQCGGTGQ